MTAHPHPLAAAFPLLTPAQLDQISSLAENVAIEKGSVLLQEGRHPEALYMITGGVADLVKHLSELEAMRKAGVTRVLVPAMGGAGLDARIRGPEDLASWTPILERYRNL